MTVAGDEWNIFHNTNSLCLFQVVNPKKQVFRWGLKC